MILYILLPLSNIFFILNIVHILSLCGIDPMPKKRTLTAGLVLVSIMALLEAYRLIHNHLINIFLFLFLMCIPFILYRKIRLSYIFIPLLLDSITNFFTSNALMLISDLTADYEITAFSNLVSRAGITAIILFAKKKISSASVKKIINHIPNYIYILIFANLYFISFASSVNNQLPPTYNGKAYIINIFIILSILCSTAIIILLIFNVMLKKHSEDNMNRLDSQIKLQISHYEKLDRHSSEMRRFRHDYRNHLRAILSLITMDEPEEAREYIANILNIEETPELAFDTGNCLADAILTDKAEQFSGGTIDFKGVIPDSLENTDVCTVLSNALDNAIEACNACGKLHIDITASVKQGFFVITFANPTEMADFSGGIPETTKPDTSAHGYGIMSIETAARRNEGRINLNCENGRFTLSVLMKM